MIFTLNSCRHIAYLHFIQTFFCDVCVFLSLGRSSSVSSLFLMLLGKQLLLIQNVVVLYRRDPVVSYNVIPLGHQSQAFQGCPFPVQAVCALLLWLRWDCYAHTGGRGCSSPQLTPVTDLAFCASTGQDLLPMLFRGPPLATWIYQWVGSALRLSVCKQPQSQLQAHLLPAQPTKRPSCRNCRHTGVWLFPHLLRAGITLMWCWSGLTLAAY